MKLKLLLFIGSAFTCSLLIAAIIFFVVASGPYPTVKRSKRESHYIDARKGESFPFPSIQDSSSIHLSVVVPAYNEQDRLPPMLDECISFLDSRTNFDYEIIVVSDGSKDDTVKIANAYSEKLGTDKFRVLDLEKNRGKGGAVRLGVQSARGAFILFADADGATTFQDLIKLEVALAERLQVDYLKQPEVAAEKLGVAVGSRAHLEREAVARRSLFRTVLMYGFHACVWLFTVRGVKDTQCGFKLLTRKAARLCFDSLHVERWAFDAELLYIANYLRIPIVEVAVRWTEKDGSKLVPVFSWIQMGMDLLTIWLRYQIGAWKVKPMEKD